MNKIAWVRKDTMMSAMTRSFITNDRNFKVADDYCHYDEPMVWGVNWYAIGTATPEDTIEFARQITKASEFAKKLTELELVVDHELEDEIITDNDAYEAERDRLEEMFDNEDYDAVIEWMKEGVK